MIFLVDLRFKCVFVIVLELKRESAGPGDIPVGGGQAAEWAPVKKRSHVMNRFGDAVSCGGACVDDSSLMLSVFNK